MARLVPKVRKVSVKKIRVKEDPEIFCVICGNTNAKQLANGYRPADRTTDKKLVLETICKTVTTCANMVSLLERKS